MQVYIPFFLHNDVEVLFVCIILDKYRENRYNITVDYKYDISDEKEEYFSFALSERPRSVQVVRQGRRRSLLS